MVEVVVIQSSFMNFIIFWLKYLQYVWKSAICFLWKCKAISSAFPGFLSDGPKKTYYELEKPQRNATQGLKYYRCCPVLHSVSVMFRSSHFSFLVFDHFWRWSYENTKTLHNLCLHFARQDGQDRKETERKSSNLSDQNTKNQKTKIWDERNRKAIFNFYGSVIQSIHEIKCFFLLIMLANN